MLLLFHQRWNAVIRVYRFFLTSQMVAHRFIILFAIPLTQRGAVTMKILTVPWYRTHSNGAKKNSQTMSPQVDRLCPASLSEIRDLLLKNVPRKIESLQAEVVHIYVDASFDRQKYSGMVVDMSRKTLFSSVKLWTMTRWTILCLRGRRRSSKSLRWRS